MSEDNNPRRYTQAIEYLYKILKIIDIVGMINTTPLMFMVSRTSSSSFRKRLQNLFQYGYIDVIQSDNRGMYYKLTKTGKEALEKIEKIIPILEQMDPMFKFDEIELGSLTNETDQEFIKSVIKRKDGITIPKS